MYCSVRAVGRGGVIGGEDLPRREVGVGRRLVGVGTPAGRSRSRGGSDFSMDSPDSDPDPDFSPRSVTALRAPSSRPSRARAKLATAARALQ